MRSFVAPHRIDGLIHERVRLGIMSVLAGGRSAAFTRIKSLLKVTDGNLSAHAWALEKAGYIRISKSFVGRKPRTELRLTARGARALKSYLSRMAGVYSA